MFRILLVGIKASDPVMQLAPYYLKAYLDKHGSLARGSYEVELQVFPHEATADEIARALGPTPYDLVGFTCYLWNIKTVLAVAALLEERSLARTIVLGGPEVSPRAREVLQGAPQIDVVARGEGEETFRCLVEALFHERGLSEVAGITYRDGEGIHEQPPRESIEPIGRIPSPYLEGLVNDMAHEPIMVTETMRGCTFKCHFCYYHKDFDRMRYFDLERVEAELVHVLSRRPAHLYLMDATFNIHPKRAKDVLRLYIKHNQGTRLHTELMAELLDEELVELLFEARSDFIEVGLQSASADTHRSIKRYFNRRRFVNGITLLKKYADRMPFEISLIDMLPGEGYGDVKRSIDWTLDLDPPSLTIMRLLLVPGTQLAKDAEKLGIQHQPDSPYMASSSPDMSPADVANIHRLRFGLGTLYHPFRRTVRALVPALGITYTDVLEAWARFLEAARAAAEAGTQADDTSFLPVRFFRSLCEERGSPAVFASIAPTLDAEMLSFPARQLLELDQGLLRSYVSCEDGIREGRF